MTLAEYRRLIESQAPGGFIPRDWVLEQLGAVDGEVIDVESWVGTERASEITMMTPEDLRRQAVKWRGVPNPEIRVTKNDNDNHLSRWLFAEEDCWAYARRKGDAVPSDPPDDPDDPTGIADRYLERIGPNL